MGGQPLAADSVRIVFLGNPRIAVPALRALANEFKVTLVVTHPERPAGRRRKPAPTAIKEEALQLGLEVYQAATCCGEEAFQRLSAARPDFLVVLAFGERLPKRLLGLPALAPINAHPSLLPRHRGPSPISAAILSGDTETGVTTMRLVSKVDAGPIYLQETTPIVPSDTAASLSERLGFIAAELLPKTIRGILCGALRERPQECVAAEAPTYCRIVRSMDGLVNWGLSAIEIERMVRAYLPWPSAYTFVTDSKGRRKMLKILKAVVVSAQAESYGLQPLEPGTVLAAPDSAGQRQGRLLVATAEGVLEALQVQPESSRAMSAAEYLRGHPLAAGTRLG